MFTETVQFSDVVDEALDALYRTGERPQRLTLADDLTSGSTSASFVESNVRLGTSDVIEVGSELLLVREVISTDPTLDVEADREYLGTDDVASVPSGTACVRNPQWPRYEVARWVAQCFRSVFNAELPKVVLYEPPDPDLELRVIPLPADTLRVVQVRSQRSDERITDIGGWKLEHWLPSSISSTGVGLVLHPRWGTFDNLFISVIEPYVSADLVEGGTVDVSPAARDLAPLWASAYAVLRREVSRSELDRIVEWNQSEAIRQGVNVRLVRDLWGEFYRRLDEAKEVWRVPNPIMYNTRGKVYH